MNQLQSKILDIFKVTRNIIEKHNLKYFAIGGTCIGAIRHKGFIPWDDDLDIGMPREDYNKLMEILPKELPEYLTLRKINDNCHYALQFAKVIDKKTTIIENLMKDYPGFDEGVYLDIMPFDGFPDDVGKRKRHIQKLKFYQRADMKLRFKFNLSKSLKSKAMYIVMYPLKMFLSHDYFTKKFQDEVSKYSIYNCKLTGFKWELTSKNIIFDTDCILGTIEMQFEDTKIKIPKGYDKYLITHFGNYMELPPEEERNSCHDFVIIDFNIPYKEYRKIKGDIIK